MTRAADKHMAPPIRVVVIDDHRTLLWGLERLIDGEHPRMHVVGKATTARDGLSVVRETRPDVVLLGIHASSEDGIDAVPQLLERGAGRVLILTALRDATMHDRAVMAGARGIVGKGHHPDDIVKAIEKVHHGELWLDRASTSRLFTQLSRRRTEEDNDPEQRKIAALTPRERSIVREVVRDAGATTKAIADKLNISDRTLRNHLTSIYGKLGVANRLELLMYASKRGLGDEK